MLIFANGVGRLTVIPSQLNQNSNRANTIYLTGAFPLAAVVTLAFTLPDGTHTEPQLMTGDKTVEYNGEKFIVREYTIPKNITQVKGRATVQFFITSNNGEETLATEATDITIAAGVPALTPAAPTESVYNQILDALSSIQTEFTNKLDKVTGATPNTLLYAKDKSGSQIMEVVDEAVSGQSIPRRSAYGTIDVAPAKNEDDAVNLQQMLAIIAEALVVKLDKSGGTISGDLEVNKNLVVKGDFTAQGKTFIEDATTLAVKNAIIETNAGKTDLKTLLSGLVINKNSTTAYGFVYDPTDDTVKFGQGSVDENGVFTFNTGEGAPIATRADSSTFTAEHLVKWDNVKKRFVDAGKSISEVGKTPKSIDAVNGAFTSVTYDTTDGITLVSITKIINTDDSEYTATLSQEIPIVPGDGISIDKQANADKIEVKIDQNKNFTIYGDLTRNGGYFTVDDSSLFALGEGSIYTSYGDESGGSTIIHKDPSGTYKYKFPINISGTHTLLSNNTVKTLFGNKSIVGEGNIDLFNHDIEITGLVNDTPISIEFNRVSSKNIVVNSINDLITLLGNKFKISVSGYEINTNSTSIIHMLSTIAGGAVLRYHIGTEDYPVGDITNLTITDTVTTV